MKPTTLEEALSLVPTHWPLTPGVDKWQDGDEYFSSSVWKRVNIASWVGQDVGDNCRRPIPQDVRESIAEMILHAARDTAKDSTWAEDLLGRWIQSTRGCDNDMFSRLDEMENYRRPRVSASSLQKMRENSTGGVMTPGEAKPRDLDDLFEEGWKFKVGRIDGAGWFTAKETAEIAKAYGRACLHSYMDKAADTVERFENLFEEWSK